MVEVEFDGLTNEGVGGGYLQRPVEGRLRVLLEMLREATGADIVYLSRFVDGQQHLRIVVGEHAGLRLFEGAATPLQTTYCWRIPHNIIPTTIRDSSADDRVAGLPGHTRDGIGGYVSSPVYLPDGQVYGSICCINSEPIAPEASTGREQMLVIASLISEILPRFEAERSGVDRSHAEIAAFIRGDGIRTVLQPVVDMATGAVAGYEALSRFGANPRHAPDWWLGVAQGLDLGLELELAMIRSAVAAILAHGIDRPVSVNASPQLLAAPAFLRELDRVADHRLVVEITERAIVSDYQGLRPILQMLRSRGCLVAVDDAGAGFATFRHMLELRPDIIKLDISLTRDIDHDESRQALAQALISYGERIDTPLVAEGIETAAEAAKLLALGYCYGQGFWFAQPMAPAELSQFDGSARIAELKQLTPDSATERSVLRSTAAWREENRRLQVELRRAEETLNEMTHEMRTPLNVILGFAHLLQTGGTTLDESKRDRYLSNILHGGDDMLALVNEALDVAKLRAGAAPLSPLLLDLRGLVDEVAESLRPVADSAGVQLQAEGPQVQAYADRRMVKQALLNLVSNGLKFTGRGGSVTISTVPGEANARVGVADTGPGIRAEDYERIFEPFRQLEGRAAMSRGTGLGLTLTRKMVEAQRGRIWVESEVGTGSTFWIELPDAAQVL